MDKSLNVGVLFLIFNRLDTTQKVFESIRQAKPPRLYIASDGARENKEGEAAKVDEIREYVLSHIDWECEVKTLFREHNLGCRRAVSSAIDWFFENEEMGIILEDDCLPSQSFFGFCQELLEKYKDDTRVMNIGGSNILNSFAQVDYNDSYYFSKNVHIWGWATWRRAWLMYDVDLDDLEEFKKEKKINDIYYYEKLFRRSFIKTLDRMKYEHVDTWDHQWVYTILKNNALSIIPAKNMITNLGFDENATHTKDSNDILSNLSRYDIDQINHPNFILPDSKYDKVYYKKMIVRQLQNIIKNFKVFR